MWTTIIIAIGCLLVGWKIGRSYAQGEGILEGYQIGYRDAVRSYVEQYQHRETEWEFEQHKLN